MRPFGHPVYCIFLVVCAALLSGCDLIAASEETVILRGEEAVFRFVFSPDTVSTDETSTLVSSETERVDLASFVESQGFEENDIREVFVEGAVLEMTFPTGQKLGFLEEATFGIVTSDLPFRRLAGRSGIPDRRQISLNLIDARDVGRYVSREMRGRLLVDIGRELPDDEFEMEVSFDLAAEVGGF